MEDLLHCFVSSGFADRPDASPCRTITSSTRDGEVGGHESAQARGGRRSWRLGFSHQVNGLRVGQIWSAGLARTPSAYSLASSLRPSTSPHFAENPPQVPFILWSSPLANHESMGQPMIARKIEGSWKRSQWLNTGACHLVSISSPASRICSLKTAMSTRCACRLFFINARFERLLRNANRSTQDGTLTCPIPGSSLYRLQPPRKAAEVFLTNYISCFLSWAKTKKYCSLQPLYVLWLLTIVLSNFPQQKVQLKIGVPIMLLRNINQSIGLCNGTRRIVIRLGEWVLEARVLTGNNTGDIVCISGIVLTGSSSK